MWGCPPSLARTQNAGNGIAGCSTLRIEKYLRLIRYERIYIKNKRFYIRTKEEKAA